MNTYANKAFEDKNNVVENASPKLQGANESSVQFSDNRPEAIAQRKIREIADNSVQVKELAHYGKMADNSTIIKQSAQLKAMAAGSNVVQRVIDPATFARLDHSVVVANPVPYARLTRDVDGVVCAARRATLPATGFEVAASTAPTVWVAVTAVNLPAQYSWPNERIDYALPSSFEKDPAKRRQTKVRGGDVVNQVGAGGTALTIREYTGDDLAMVHHTTGGGSQPHLTVENAHISAMHHIISTRAITGFNKGAKTKPQHEDTMAGYESTRTDNLNFFAASSTQPVHNLSLAEYLRVISYAMDHIAAVPPVYGVEIVRSANAIAAAQGMDPAALFLPRGVGLERQLFKAALNMHKMGLIIVPTTIATAFAGYAQPAPQLADPVTAAIVREGEGPWSALQTLLIDTHLAALITYLKTL